MTEGKTCGTCRHWVPTDKTEPHWTGQCHVHGPIVDPEGAHYVGYPDLLTGLWPTTYADDSCGDWENIPEATP
jgi:hypothetical protein